MPNIPEYNATAELTPSDKGIQAAEVAGRRIGQFYHDIGNDVKNVANAVEQHMSVMETSELYKTGTELRLNLQTKYDKESALPENRNDPHFGDRFMAEVGPQLDQWGQGAGTDHGKMLAATLKSQIRNEIFNHVAAGQSEMDAAHAEDNSKQTMNLLGSGLITDPSGANLNRTLGTAKDAIDGMTMAIPDVGTRERIATELRSQYLPQLVIARYRGVAESIKNQISETGASTSPALEQLNKDIDKQLGFEHLSPEMQARIPEIRDEAVRQGQELFRSKDATQRKAEDDAVEGEMLKVDTAMFKTNATGGTTVVATPDLLTAVDRIAKMPGAERHASAIRELLSALHGATQDQIDGKETVTDRSTYMGLSGKIGSTADPLTKAQVDEARAAHKLSDSDYHFLRESASDTKAANPKINHAMEELHRQLQLLKPMIDKSDIYSGIDQAGAQQFANFSWEAENAVRKGIAAGQDPEKTVQDFTNPHNPHGLQSYIPRYQTTNKQGLAHVLQSVQPNGVQPTVSAPGGVSHAPPPPLKGESPAAYLKRTNQ